ncbi:Protein of unknown function [Pyronema omphalodes CBS 100304]|uniref:Uncharacterized protein n=1 Tax=Pyronema omphalodes (strain CBS 100304) TaxID=1076935 RepID=U4LJG3_PYROM|nr:Protein of unknown function [Pyronema omphalodes CBS 100304]
MSLFRLSTRLPTTTRASAMPSIARLMSSKVPSKDELSPRSKEQTRSATHEEIAQDSTAYNSDTNPQSQKQSVGQE